MFSNFFSHSFDNPFKISINIKNKSFPALIDTGADDSLIPQAFLPFNIKIEKIKNVPELRSASNQQLTILGYVKGIKILFKNKIYNFCGWVVPENPNI